MGRVAVWGRGPLPARVAVRLAEAGHTVERLDDDVDAPVGPSGPEGPPMRALAGADTLVVVDVPATGPDPAALRRVLASAHVPPHLVVLSHALAYGAWADNPVPLTEAAPLRPNPANPVAAGLAEIERVVSAWVEAGAGRRAAVLRPAVVAAPLDLWGLQATLSRLARWRVAGTDAAPVQVLHPDDLLDAVVVAVGADLDGPLNVAPSGWVPGELVPEVLGVRASPGVPAAVLPAVVGRDRAWLPWARHAWVVAPDLLEAAGWTPRWTSEEAVLSSRPARLAERLTARRRQQLALGAPALAVAGVALATGAAVVWWRRRLRRRAARPA